MSLNNRPSLRGEIESVLNHFMPGAVIIAGTAKWVAQQLDVPTKAVAVQLEAMRLEGKVTTRRLRSGELVWKLTDANHEKWNNARSLILNH